LQDSLNKATSAKEKANICYAISTWYSDRLKIDSGFFYANKIKEFSQSAGYETGIGKYHLASSFALRYRGRNGEAEENALKAIEIFTRQKEILLLGRSYWQLATIQYGSIKSLNQEKTIGLLSTISFRPKIRVVASGPIICWPVLILKPQKQTVPHFTTLRLWK
jgi:hypothetical protein